MARWYDAARTFLTRGTRPGRVQLRVRVGKREANQRQRCREERVITAWAWNAVSLREVPIAAWVVAGAVILFVGEYVLLRLRQRQSRTAEEAARRRLSLVATALRNHAAANGGALPRDIGDLGLPGVSDIVYRPVPTIDFDPRLLLIYDAIPTHRVIEFPVLRDGRAAVFSSGRLVVVSEEVFDKLRAADDALRERLNLPPV